jgi:hypothetical protein
VSTPYVDVVVPPGPGVVADVTVDTAVGAVDVFTGVPGPPGDTGPAGPQGQPGGAVMSAWWQYSTSTSAPPSSGQIRSSTASPGVPGTDAVLYIHHTDDDGLVWDMSNAQVGDQVVFKDDHGNTWTTNVTSVANTVPGGAGYHTVGFHVLVASGSPAKNRRVLVSLVRPGTANMAWVNVVNPATDIRPAFPSVMWVGGTVRPANMAAGDLWVKG